MLFLSPDCSHCRIVGQARTLLALLNDTRRLGCHDMTNASRHVPLEIGQRQLLEDTSRERYSFILSRTWLDWNESRAGRVTYTSHRNAQRHGKPREGDARKLTRGARREDDEKALVRKVLLEIMLLDEIDIQRS